MYKLFLCLRYLRRRHLALIAVAAVALCVAMMLIVVSVYDGFLSTVEHAAKGLFGDIIIDSPSLSAIGRYDEFIAKLTGQCRVDADFSLARATRRGQVTEVVFVTTGTSAHAEALAGRLRFDEPVEYPARAMMMREGRFGAELRGQLVIEPGRTRADSKELDYPIRFTARTELAAEEFTRVDGALAPRAVYARVGEGISEIASATPVIYTYGLLRIGQTFTTAVQICGIRLPERLAVTDFGRDLFVQAGRQDASFRPPLEDILARLREHLDLIRRIEAEQAALPPGRRDPELRRKLTIARKNTVEMFVRLTGVQELRRRLGRLRTELAAEKAKPPDARDADKIKDLTERVEKISQGLNEEFLPPRQRVILGLGIGGLSFRTPDGETVRWVSPGRLVTLTLLPIHRGGLPTTLTPNTRQFTVIDDAKTDVWTVDSMTVYVPFAALQELAEMFEHRDEENPAFVIPARCSQIQIKVKPAHSAGAELVAVRKKVDAAWAEFLRRHPEASDSEILIHTWQEKLAKFIGPVQKQRTLVTIMFGIISSVSVLLIFAIFYMIVMQKIRDIGVIRAVGGSAPGVAQMFLGYGAATGVVGSIIGLIGGYYFVRYINEIEDWLASWSGFRVWERDVFLFERIPNEVDATVALVIAIWAIASGLVGALIPAVRASVMEPAEAVRYE